MIQRLPAEKYVKAVEAADRLGVKAVTVRAWLKQGLFPNAKLEVTILGKVRLIPESDLKNFQKPEMGRPSKQKDSKEYFWQYGF